MFTLPEPTEALIRRYDAPGPRYTSYPTAPMWSTRFGPEEHVAKLVEASALTDAPLSVYVHLPFCESMCAYCGCNVVVARRPSIVERYLDHVDREIALAAGLLGSRRRVAQLHWGGGTPTFLNEPQLARLHASLSRVFAFDSDAERSVEIDPIVTSVSQLSLLRALGFNRLSMGVQDFDPRVQEAIDRIQPADETKAALDTARGLGFGAVNFDLIYGLPRQTPESWDRTLEQVVAMRPDRLAVYSFAYLPHLKPNQRRVDGGELPKGLDKLRLFLMAYETFVRAGYRPIGMDHFALPEDELARAQDKRKLGRNFQGYTVRAAADSVAFGATAISDVAGAYAQSFHSLARCYAAVDAGRLPTERGLALTPDDRRRRAVITQLMCNFWTDLGSDGWLDAELERLAPLADDGLLELHGSEVTLTPLGRLFVRNVAMVFDAYLRLPGEAPTYSRTV